MRKYVDSDLGVAPGNACVRVTCYDAMTMAKNLSILARKGTKLEAEV